MIKKKLSFTNGWHIEEERYDELVKELTEQIILTIEERIEELEDAITSNSEPKGSDD